MCSWVVGRKTGAGLWGDKASKGSRYGPAAEAWEMFFQDLWKELVFLVGEQLGHPEVGEFAF